MSSGIHMSGYNMQNDYGDDPEDKRENFLESVQESNAGAVSPVLRALPRNQGAREFQTQRAQNSRTLSSAQRLLPLVNPNIRQIEALQFYYNMNPYPSDSILQNISRRIGVSMNFTREWYRREYFRRQRIKFSEAPRQISYPIASGRSVENNFSTKPVYRTPRPTKDLHNLSRPIEDHRFKPENYRTSFPYFSGMDQKVSPNIARMTRVTSPFPLPSYSRFPRRTTRFTNYPLSLVEAYRPNFNRKNRRIMDINPFFEPLPEPKEMVTMIKEAVKELKKEKIKPTKINIKNWIKESYDTSKINLNSEFVSGLSKGIKQSVLYEFSNTIRLTENLLKESSRTSNNLSEEEFEASCPIPSPIPTTIKGREDALKGFIMGEILSQEPHFSLAKKEIFKRIETMTPENFKIWALYEEVNTKKDEESPSKNLKEGNSENKSKSPSSSSEEKTEVTIRRSLRKTPKRILKEQMDLLNKQRNDFLNPAHRKQKKSYAEKVLEVLVDTRRLAIWLKPKPKYGNSSRNNSKNRKVYFATKKSIQWKAHCERKLHVAPFSKCAKEEDAFFAKSDINSMSPQEEVIKRKAANKEIENQIKKYAARKARFFLKHEKVFLPFVSEEYINISKKESKKTCDKDLPRLKTPLKTQPAAVSGELHPYQIDGLNWLIRLFDDGLCGILGDEMGLGKTVQTISLIAYLKSVRKVPGPHLVVCPLNVLSNWCNEFARWAPSLRVVRFHGPERELNRVMRDRMDIGTFDVIVTTFEMVLSSESALVKRFNYQCVVVDEAHRVKNEMALISESLRHVTAFFKVLLTGTPLQNNLKELWSLLNLLYPEQFVSAQTFDKGFNLIGNKVNVDTMLRSQKVLKLFMLRRLKSEVAKLPPKLETNVLVPMSECQIFWYKRLLAYQYINLSEEKKRNRKTSKKLITLIMELRKCCNHPFLFPNCEPDVTAPDYGQKIIDSCGKMQILDKMLSRLKENGNRVLLFSQFTSVLDIIEEYCRYREIVYLRLDGSTNRVQRQFDIARFNNPGSNIFLFLITTRAGGLGVNLHTADTVVMYDSDWNPQADLQAQDRAHRIGQEKTVRVFKLITEDSIEERIAQRAEKKLYLDAVVNTQGELDENSIRKTKKSSIKKSNKKELLSLLTFGAERVFSSKGKKINDEDIDLILNLNEDGAKEKNISTLNRIKNAGNYNVNAGNLAITRFRGKELEEKLPELEDPSRTVERIAEEWALENGREIPTFEPFEDPQDELAFLEVKCKRFFGHEDICHACKGEGLLLSCEWCPRSYHHDCVGLDDMQAGSSFKCPQHKCEVCFRSAHEAGGMLFRCVSCPMCCCEDHVCFDVIPAEGCKSLEALGYKKSSSVCYVLCGEKCVEIENERKKKESRRKRDMNSENSWDQLPLYVKKKFKLMMGRNDRCLLAEIPGFSRRLQEIDPRSPLLSSLLELLYPDSFYAHVHSKLNKWGGLGFPESANEKEKLAAAADFYVRLSGEFGSWRLNSLIKLSNLLGIWTRSEVKRIKSGSLSGRETKPKDRNVSPVDSEKGLVCHLAAFLLHPSQKNLFLHHSSLKKNFDLNKDSEIIESNVLRYFKTDGPQKTNFEKEKSTRMREETNERADFDNEPSTRPRLVVVLRRENEGTYSFLQVLNIEPTRLRPRKKRKVWQISDWEDDEEI